MSSGQVVTQPGSLINIAGGSISYQSGFLQNSYVIATNGQVYNVNLAPANLTYTGVFGGFNVDHPRWGITDTYGTGIVDPAQTFVAGYTVGMDAGTLVVSAPSASLQGDIDASVTPGPTQTKLPAAGVENTTLPDGSTQRRRRPGFIVDSVVLGCHRRSVPAAAERHADRRHAAGRQLRRGWPPRRGGAGGEHHQHHTAGFRQ